MNLSAHVFYLYRSESPSQVFLIIIQWLLSLTKESSDQNREIILAYDNMCNLAKLKIARSPLPFQPPLDRLWLDVKKVIDVFYFKNNISPECQRQFSPAKVKEEHPHFNTPGWRADICLGPPFCPYTVLDEQSSPLILSTPYGCT